MTSVAEESARATSKSAQQNIETIVRLEQEAVRESEADREADRLSQQTHLETLAQEVEKSLVKS